MQGKMIWNTAFTEEAVYKSLQYSPTLETVYYTSWVSSKLAIMLMNSIDGIFNKIVQLQDVSQWQKYCSCALSDDESALF